MSYALGVDLGTTFTAAAVCEPGRRPEMVSLGSSAYAVPSVLFLREDGSFLAGEAASMRASGEPTRVARHFKRRVGDTVPLQIAGTPFPAQALVSRLLSWVLETVTARRGEAPTNVVLTHPANWGPYRCELFEQAAATAGAEGVTLQSEPEAAAIEYTRAERVDPGELIGVYDLGGGTFDAVVMRRTRDGFEVVGTPHGVERLGGLDFDEVIWQFVLEASDLDTSRSDPATMAAAHQLRDRCVEAKRLLSVDTSASIHVVFPDLARTVRLTRSEFEQRIRPRLVETMGAFRNAIESGGLQATDLNRVLLVGGSSRIPLISQMLSKEFGRPIAVDSDPKNTVALGAARTAALLSPASKSSGPPPALAPQALADAAERARSEHADHEVITLPDSVPVHRSRPRQQVATVGVPADGSPRRSTVTGEARDGGDDVEIIEDGPGGVTGVPPRMSTRGAVSPAPAPTANDLRPGTRRQVPRVSSESVSFDTGLESVVHGEGGPDTHLDLTDDADARHADPDDPNDSDEFAEFEESLQAVSPESRHRIRFTAAPAVVNPFEDDEPDEPPEVEPAAFDLRRLLIVGSLVVLLLILVAVLVFS